MADKEKRLRKILIQLGLRGVLKPAKTLEENYIVIVDAPDDPVKYYLYKKRRVSTVIRKRIYLFS